MPHGAARQQQGRAHSCCLIKYHCYERPPTYLQQQSVNFFVTHVQSSTYGSHLLGRSKPFGCLLLTAHLGRLSCQYLQYKATCWRYGLATAGYRRDCRRSVSVSSSYRAGSMHIWVTLHSPFVLKTTTTFLLTAAAPASSAPADRHYVNISFETHLYATCKTLRAQNRLPTRQAECQQYTPCCGCWHITLGRDSPPRAE